MTLLCPSPSTVNQGQDEATEKRQIRIFQETMKVFYSCLPSHYKKATVLEMFQYMSHWKATVMGV